MKNSHNIYFILGVLGVLCLSEIALGQGTVRYVKSGATGDGSSWNNASGELQKMIDISSVGDEIWISSGTYYPSELIKTNKKRSYAFKLKNGVSLYGGFSGIETNKEDRIKGEAIKPMEYIFTNQTIISGDIDGIEDIWIRKFAEGSTVRYIWQITGNEKNSNHLFYTEENITEPIVIDGFTLIGAYADVWQVKASGAALYASGNISLLNSIVRQNAVYTSVEGNLDLNGGAVTIINGNNAKISNCLFENNFVYLPNLIASGGSIYIEKGSVEKSIFKNSVGVDKGGAITIKDGNIKDCSFYDCYGASGGSIYSQNSFIDRCYIAHSRALMGGGIHAENTNIHHTTVVNCYADDPSFGESGGGKGGGIFAKNNTSIIGSIATNCSSGSKGGGIYLETGCKIFHSTVQNNSLRLESTDSNIGYLGNITIGNSIFADNISTANFKTPTQNKGFSEEENERNLAVKSDWALSEGSEFIQTGEIIEGIEEVFDMRGNKRITNNKIDRGALAYIPTNSIETGIIKDDILYYNDNTKQLLSTIPLNRVTIYNYVGIVQSIFMSANGIISVSGLPSGCYIAVGQTKSKQYVSCTFCKK